MTGSFSFPEFLLPNAVPVNNHQAWLGPDSEGHNYSFIFPLSFSFKRWQEKAYF